MLVNEDLEKEVLAIIESTIFKPVTANSSLVKSGLVDSMAAVDIALALEEKYGCSIPAPEIAQIFETAKSITAYVAANAK